MVLSDSFIGAGEAMCELYAHVSAPYLRKEFKLAFVPERASITLTGLGFYELYVNGVKTVKGEMCPYISNPDDICYYDTYDITDKLVKGENCIGVLLGNGFRNAMGGFVWDFDKAASRGPVALALCLEAEGEGKSLTLEADESFKTYPSPVLFDDIRMGYQYDSRLECEGWCLPGYDDRGWRKAKRLPSPNGEKRLCTADPIVVREEVAPVRVRHYDELAFAYKTTAPGAEPYKETVRQNVYVYDFGINSAGVTALRIDGLPGQRIVIRHGEHLNGESFNELTTIFGGQYLEKYLEYGQKDVFICKGGEEMFVPRFKYDGFRYAYVEGILPEQAQRVKLTFLVMGSDVKPRAGFMCSDETLNALQRMTRRSDLSNFVYFPTDCPHREKNGWTGDASVSAEQMLLNLGVSVSLKEWLRNIVKAQRKDGALPGIVPTGGWGFDWGNGPAWDMVAASLPYSIYKYDGDADAIKENAPMIVSYLKYAETRLDEKGLAAYGLGDWCDPGACDGKPQAPLCVTDTIQLYEMASKATYMFEYVGLTSDAEYTAALAQRLREAVRRELVDDDMTVSGDCQCSQAFALETGIFNIDELPQARRRLVEIVHRDGDISLCGMIGMRHLFRALINADEAELAYKLITNDKNCSCYGYWVKSGSTTLQEKFLEVNSPRLNSKNHHFFGDISAVLITELVGLRPSYYGSENGRERYVVHPHPVAALDFASAYYDGSTGRASVEWRRERGDRDVLTLEVSLPPHCMGEIVVPKGWAYFPGDDNKGLGSIAIAESEYGASGIYKLHKIR